MAQPFSGTTTISSAGTSPPIMLDPTARVTQIQLIATSLTTAAATVSLGIQCTLDVNVASSLIVWDSLSSVLYTSANIVDGAILQILSPVAGIRMNSSVATWGGGSATLKVLQSIIG